MSLSRLLACGALLIAGAVVIATPACIVPHKFENGEECIKDDECQSGQCIQLKCMARNGDACWRDSGCASGSCKDGHCVPVTNITPADSGADTGTPTDGGTDATPADTTPADTTPADTTPATDAASDADEAG